MTVHVNQQGARKEPLSTFVTIDIDANQRIEIVLATGDGIRRPLRVWWQRRASDRYSWEGPNAERISLGYATLDTGLFEVKP